MERSSDPNDGRQVIFRLKAEGRRVRVDETLTYPASNISVGAAAQHRHPYGIGGPLHEMDHPG